MTSRDAARDPLDRMPAWILPIFLWTGTFLLGAWLMDHRPVLHWTDSYVRLAYRDQILVNRWLPGLQLVIFTVSKFSRHLVAVRLTLTAVSALSVVVMYGLTGRVFGRTAGLLAAFWLATNSLFLDLATIPYQENLFLFFFLLGLYFLSAPGPTRAGGLSLNLACLIRYEAWFMTAILGAESFVHAWKKEGSLRAGRDGLRAAAHYGAIPIVLWLALGTARFRPEETKVGAKLSLGYLVASFHDFILLIPKYLGYPLLALALLGLFHAWRIGRASSIHRRIALFLLVDFFLVIFLDPFGFGNQRRAGMLMPFLIFYAGPGALLCANDLSRRVGRRLGTSAAGMLKGLFLILLTAGIAGGGIRNARQLYVQAQHEPIRAGAFKVAGWLHTLDYPVQRLVVFSRQFVTSPVLAVHLDIPMDNIYRAAPGQTPDKEFFQSHLDKGERIGVIGFADSFADFDTFQTELQDVARTAPGHLFNKVIFRNQKPIARIVLIGPEPPAN